MIFKLAYKNLMGAKLRTWLTVISLSFTYLLIIWSQSIYLGMQEEGTANSVEEEIAAGQYWQEEYDPFDLRDLSDNNIQVKGFLKKMIDEKEAFPQLLIPGSIYPDGRLTNVIIRGISPEQGIINLDFSELNNKKGDIPVILGTRMAGKYKFNEGDYITVRFRDSNGTFDAVDAIIVKVIRTKVPGMDKNQLWFNIEDLYEMTGLKSHATIVTISEKVKPQVQKGWIYRDHAFLLKDLNDMVLSKKVGGAIMFSIFLFLAMLAVFDTQILSIFRRKKEIGTLIALGMTRKEVVGLFTLEGSMHGILAAIVSAVLGTPLMMIFSKIGLSMPAGAMDDYGYALSDTIYPVITIMLVLATVLIVMLTVIIVSYLPSREIAAMKPTEALKGKVS